MWNPLLQGDCHDGSLSTCTNSYNWFHLFTLEVMQHGIYDRIENYAHDTFDAFTQNIAHSSAYRTILNLTYFLLQKKFKIAITFNYAKFPFRSLFSKNRLKYSSTKLKFQHFMHKFPIKFDTSLHTFLSRKCHKSGSSSSSSSSLVKVEVVRGTWMRWQTTSNTHPIGQIFYSNWMVGFVASQNLQQHFMNHIQTLSWRRKIECILAWSSLPGITLLYLRFHLIVIQSHAFRTKSQTRAKNRGATVPSSKNRLPLPKKEVKKMMHFTPCGRCGTTRMATRRKYGCGNCIDIPTWRSKENIFICQLW